MTNVLVEKMSPQDKLVKEKLIEYLINTGYGTYAKRLKEFDVYVAEIFNGIQIQTAAMFPETGDIVINPGFFELPDENQAWDQLSVLIRHEMLHFLLVHEKRLVDYLKATDPNFEENYRKASVHQIANYAMDWELSELGYDDHDKEVVRVMTLNGEVIGGLILSDDHPEWLNKPMEELYELVKKEVEEGRLQLPSTPGGTGAGASPSQDYADGWNAAMAKFDDPNISDQELNDVINQISSGQLTTIQVDSSTVVDLTNLESKQGALDALKLILKSRKQPIKVKNGSGGGGGPKLTPPKNIEVEGGDASEDSSQDQGDQDGQSSSNKTDSEDSEETPEERAQRIARINDPDGIEQDIEDIKLDTELRNAEQARKNARKNAVDDLINGKSGGNLAEFESFSADLFKAIATQVRQAKHKSDTYRRPNASYAGTPYLLPGKDYLDKKTVPVIGVYFDQSGSWGPDEIKKGIEAIACLHQFQKQRKLKIKLFFFANHLHDTPDPCKHEGGTRGFPEVLAHINNPANKIQNAIILTDSDIQGQTDWSKQPTVTIPGCVWFLWKRGDRSRTAPKHLKGARGTFQYKLTV